MKVKAERTKQVAKLDNAQAQIAAASQHHDAIRLCWLEIIEQMRIRPVRYAPKPPVVFAEYVMVTDGEPAKAPPKPILTAQQMAELAYPDFDWTRYNELEHEAALAAMDKLNHRSSAPLGREEPKSEPKIDNRTEIEKMIDLMTQQTGKELVKSQEVGIQNKEDMAKAVEVAYSANGNNKLERHQIMAIAALCWELGLSPNPTLGHVYGFEQNGRFMVMMGVYGLINLARRDHEFVLQDARDMTDEERKQHGLKPGDVGVMVGIIDGREIATFAKIVAGGIPVKVEDMYHWYPGVWRSEVERWDKEAKKKMLKPEDIPNTWTARQVAEKRGVRTALKRLGLNSNVGRLPNVPNYKYDSDDAAFVYEPEQITGGDSAPATSSALEPVEATFEEMLNTQVQAEAERESAAAQSEPADIAPEPAEVKSEAEPGAGETGDAKTEPTIKPKGDRPYSPSQFQPKFQTAVNTYLSNNPDSKGKIKDVSVVDGWFVGVVDTPSMGIAFVKAFCGVNSLSDITEAQAAILAGKILSKPEWAKTEIDQWMKLFAPNAESVEA